MEFSSLSRYTVVMVAFGPSHLYLLLVLSVETSIDAFAVGLSLSFLRVTIIVQSIMIGLINSSLSLLDVYVGVEGGSLLRKEDRNGGGTHPHSDWDKDPHRAP